MMNFFHVAVCGAYCLHWTAAVLTRAQIWRVPSPTSDVPLCLLVVVVVLRLFAEELCKRTFAFLLGESPTLPR